MQETHVEIMTNQYNFLKRHQILKKCNKQKNPKPNEGEDSLSYGTVCQQFV